MAVALTTVPPDLGAAALDYARDGFEVFPLHDDKSPRTPNGMKDATTDEATIRQWWSQWPGALIGCRVPPNVVILDIDSRHGGLATWKALRAAYGAPPVTRVHYSGRGDSGGHLWFQRPAGRLSIKGLNAWAREHGTGEAAGKHSWVAGIDLLHHGHRYTILPPSPHPATGRPYWWAEARGSGTEPAVTPHWLSKLLLEHPAPPRLEPLPSRHSDQDSIADWFSETWSWADLLVPEGWVIVRGNGDDDGSAWRHPNATSAQSATVRHGCLFVYSPNTDFEPTEEGDPHGYTRFRAWAELEHHGDMTAAAREARHMKGDGGNIELPATLTGGVGTEPRLLAAHTVVDESTAGLFVDWAAFWAKDRRDADWLYEDVLARGRGHSIFAGHKVGKSLLMLWLAMQLIEQGVVVVYLDYEMGEDDLFDRLSDMGFGPDTDLSRLRYALLPNLSPLDSVVGAAELASLIDGVVAEFPDDHIAVVIDTTGRAVAGEENSADTIRAFYRWTGMELKRRGITWARLDHSGKDAAKGQRGSSAKGDDVDVVWRLSRAEGGVELRREAARMGWVPERVAFQQHTDPLSYVRVASAWPSGTSEVAGLLDKVGIALDAGERPAGKALREAGHTSTQAVLRAALRWRRENARETELEALL